ncbi:putative peptidoglycan-binding domain-containing protein [Rivularia sp. PCC 7116]|uniref:peptidoglycan-binding domain-containing protein n=1 Tax=Rivularia sp. PCC 7116 TaxID=373994 RepID=UPI00029F0F65|nr:peptidoglycan-binding domain-containing protein [Rivularia sp. PCC 7116]AFY56409.1 putative peptidoglycan-binding domain-containing protein [Rivularia sp. PCC 7116]
MNQPPILRLGSQGSEVERLQQYLSAMGYEVQINGKFEENTEAALKKFQQQHNLNVDGVVGAQTGPQLNIAYSALKG